MITLQAHMDLDMSGSAFRFDDPAVEDPDDPVGDPADLRVVGDDQQGPILAAGAAEAHRSRLTARRENLNCNS